MSFFLSLRRSYDDYVGRRNPWGSSVRYKNEPVTENGHTRNKDVPYNVRRYYQHMKCDHCGHQSKYETQEEKKA